MKTYLANAGLIDLDVIRVMGVSVKENSNPIGYFGTGLKFAIATLLRYGLKVTLIRGGETYEFTARPGQIRGQEFMRVHMNEEQLPFTVDLGKNWKIWQAYRELHSNCLDEEGKISDKPLNADTVWVIEGAEFLNCYYDRGKIFLSSELLYEVPGKIEIHPGQSNIIYYRGVRAYEMPKKARFTYNVIQDMTLTEDRTLKAFHMFEYALESCIPRGVETEYMQKVMSSGQIRDYYEAELDWQLSTTPSEECLETLQRMRQEGHQLTLGASKLYHKYGPRDAEPEIQIERNEEETIQEALRMLPVLGATVRRDEIIIAENLGPNVFARFENGQIKITRRTIANGAEFTMITLYEEWVHKTFGYHDESREMQQHLFDKILQLTTMVSRNDI